MLDFISYDSKALTSFASSGSLDGSIQGEQIGTVSYLGNTVVIVL